MPSPVSPNNGELKFHRLADELRRDILASTWPPGAKLPTDVQLRADTGLALSTIRRAYNLLESQGFVVRRQGAGTFVAEQIVRAGVEGMTIGALVPVTHLYYGEVMRGIETELNAARVGLRFAIHDYDEKAERRRIDDFTTAGVDGLIVVPAGFEHELDLDRVRAFMELPVPVVLLERMPATESPATAIEYVCSDHAGGAFDAVRHLASLGHSRIALLAREEAPSLTGVQRGFHQALAHLRIGGIEIRHSAADWPTRVEHAVAGAQREDCTAALVLGDREATLLLDGARRMGVDVPRDLALVSYDDDIADIAAVPLTAVSPAKHRMGVLAGRIMVQRLQGGDSGPVHQVRLRPRVVVRRSCGAHLSLA